MEIVSYEGTINVILFSSTPIFIHNQVPLTLLPNNHTINPTISFHSTKVTIIFHPDSAAASQPVSQLHLCTSHQPFSPQRPEWVSKNKTHPPAEQLPMTLHCTSVKSKLLTHFTKSCTSCGLIILVSYHSPL